MANHGVERAHHPFASDNDTNHTIRSNGHYTKRHMVSDSNGHSVQSNGTLHHHHDTNEQADGREVRGHGDINQDAHGAKSHYVHGKLSDLQSGNDGFTFTVKDDNPYHPSNFYKEDKETAKHLIKAHRKYPKAKVPKKSRKHSRNAHTENTQNDCNEYDAIDDMESFFESIEADNTPHDAVDVYANGHFVDAMDGMANMDLAEPLEVMNGNHEDLEQMHSEEELDDEASEHFREFMADPDAQSAGPMSPRSTGDSNCIEGCQRIMPSNFHTMKPGDVVSILVDNLWTYYKVKSNEQNGDDYVAVFESGFASKDESVFIRDGVISKYMTVWGEQSEDAVAICREIDGKDDEEEKSGLGVVENGWIKLEEDGKLHLVVQYEASSGMAQLKAMGTNVERIVDLNKCGYKML